MKRLSLLLLALLAGCNYVETSYTGKYSNSEFPKNYERNVTIRLKMAPSHKSVTILYKSDFTDSDTVSLPVVIDDFKKCAYFDDKNWVCSNPINNLDQIEMTNGNLIWRENYIKVITFKKVEKILGETL